MNAEQHVFTVKHALIIPVLQALVTGVLTGLFSGLLASVFSVSSPALLGLIVGTGATFAAWLNNLSRWKRLTAWLMIGYEQEARQEQPSPSPTLQLEVIREQGRFIQYADVEARPEQLVTLGRGLMCGQSFSEAAWTGHGRPFSRSQFRQLRDIFLSRGWLVWRDSEARSQGMELTHAGKAVVRYFSELNAPTALLSSMDRGSNRGA